MNAHEEACANHVNDITLSFQRKNGQCGEKPIFDIESPCHINSHWAPLQAWWSHLIAMISKNTILQISTPQGVTTVQYLTTSLQSLKLLGRTLGLKYNHKSLHKSQFIVIYIRYIAELANVTFVQDVHDNISSGNGTSSKMLHHMIEVTHSFCPQNETSSNIYFFSWTAIFWLLCTSSTKTTSWCLGTRRILWC